MEILCYYIDMSQDEFTKLFKYMQNEFRRIDSRFEDQSSGINDLRNSIDAYAKKVDDYTQEMLMLAHKVVRQEKWINQIAASTGVKLEY